MVQAKNQSPEGHDTGQQISMDCFCIQMIKYDPNDHRVLNAGNDAYITTAFVTGFNIDIKYPLQSLCPGH